MNNWHALFVKKMMDLTGANILIKDLKQINKIFTKIKLSG